MMQKDDIQNGLLSYPTFTGASTIPKNIQNVPTNSPFHTINLLDLDQYRIKSHCHYDPNIVGTTDYSIFQIEIVSEDLQRFYQGRYILEIWNKNGERMLQKILKDELAQWKLYNNTFLYKGANDSPLIYIIWLKQKKMIAIKHPYDDNKEVDMIYFDNRLIVAQQFNFRFMEIDPEEVTTTISQFLNPDESHQPLFQKDFSGIIHNDRIFKILPNPIRNELLFICVADNHQILYYKLSVNKALEKRQVTLQKVEVDPSLLKNKKSKLDKKQMKLLEQLADVQQINLLMRNNVPYLLVLRKNQVLEIIESFGQTVYVEQRLNLTKILPSFGEKITLQFTDGSITQAQSIDKLNEKTFITESEYYRQQAMPPKTSTLYDIHKMIHFYKDSVIINQSLFLVRDSIVFVVDTFTKQVVQKFFQRQNIVCLHKLKTQSEDERGYKVTNFKVVAVHKNGTLQVFVKSNIYEQSGDWVRNEINQTAILQNKETVINAFQNQNSLNCLYMITSNSQNDQQKVYQMLYNTQIIELNLKVRKGDFIGSVNSISRQREMLAIVDSKYLIIYRNDKGNLIKLYQLNHTRFEYKELINSHSIFYFSRDYCLTITKNTVFKIKLATSAIEQSKLQDNVKQGGSCFIDATCFYFVTHGDELGHTKLAIADTSMIEASFQDITKDEVKNAVIDRNDQKGINKLMYPTWSFQSAVKRLDYDEYNAVINLQFSNYEIVQVPMLHRNTMHFMGMAERSFYLMFKKHGQYLYALDKNNHLSCWSMINGQLLSSTYVTSADYKFYEVDKDLYDKNWFPYTLIYRPSQASPTSINDSSKTDEYRTYKIIDIDEKGNIFEWLTFVHPVQRNMDTHLYFNTDLNLMIEVLLNKNNKSAPAVYNLYQLESMLSQKWKFIRTLNDAENKNSNFIEWHHKSLFPYTVNMKTLQMQPEQRVITKNYDTYKFIDKDKIKILNTQDGIEMIYNTQTQTIEAYMALQYSFANTKESFYDKKCGHFYVQEVTSRLQNYYESVRRKIYLQNKTNFKLRSLDVSARGYKHKYVLEQSYTFLDYQFYNQYIQGKERTLLKTFKQMSNDHIQRLVHNIFPEGNNTILHIIAQSDVGFECVDYLTQLAKKEGFVIPFLLNSDEVTPLDIAVAKRDFKQSNSLVKMLSKTPMDHHSRLISHLMPKLIDMNLPSLEKYFDRRRFQTGACKTITLGRINIQRDQEFKTIPSTLLNENSDNIKFALMHPKCKEQSINLEILDVPLHQFKGVDLGQKQQVETDVNEYEIRVVKSLANTENQEIFQQKSLRAFIDFMWPHSRKLIITNLFLPYLAFILYYMVYLIVLKKLTITSETDPTFFDFTAGMFTVFDTLFKVILFLGCFYFFYQDFLQIKTFTNNPIVLWSYANIFPLMLIIFIIIYDLFIDSNNSDLEKTFYSASSFFIWIRVIHLLKVFPQTSYLLRMGAEILHRMRYLICFIVISLLAFGFTFYFVSDYNSSSGLKTETPFQGFNYMFQVLLGQYDADNFNNIYLSILLVLVSFFNFFFIFTLIVALSIVSFSKNSDIYSNEAYQDNASLIALYSYLMNEKAVREPAKKYLLIATVTEGKKSKNVRSSRSTGFTGFNAIGSSDAQNLNAKMIKNMDRRLNNLTSKVEKTLKDISDRLDTVSQQQRHE